MTDFVAQIQNNTGATGWMPGEGLEALRKALDSGGYGTDVSTLTGGAALRIQSLDRVMQATIQDNQHFKLFNRLDKPPAGATVDEWTEQSNVGGFLGGSSNSELGIIQDATGAYARRVGMVKFLMTRRQVSFVQTLVNSIVESEALEYTNGAKQLLTDAEFFCFEGDSTVVPTEFDGIEAQMIAGVAGGEVDTRNVVDVRGTPLNSIGAINKIAAVITGYGNFGTPTDIYCSQLVQADFDTALDPAFRVPLTDVPDGGTKLGAPVRGIRTSWGDVMNQPDIFVRDGDQKVVFETLWPAIAQQNNTYQPAGVTVAVAADGTGASQWTAPQAGLFYYAVAGITSAGQSQAVVTSQVGISAGQMATLNITASTSRTETGYVIFRGRKNGSNALTDLRQVCRIPVTPGGTTVYVDRNQNIPGTTSAFILNNKKSDHAITWRQLLPMIKFPLYPVATAVVPWAQLMFGYLRISKRRQHGVIRNILPTTAEWRPFG